MSRFRRVLGQTVAPTPSADRLRQRSIACAASVGARTATATAIVIERVVVEQLVGSRSDLGVAGGVLRRVLAAVLGTDSANEQTARTPIRPLRGLSLAGLSPRGGVETLGAEQGVSATADFIVTHTESNI